MQSCTLNRFLWRLHRPKYIPVAQGSGYVLCEACCTCTHPWQGSVPAPKPLSQAVSGSPSQHNPRRNWCQTLCQAISSGNLVLSCGTIHGTWWGLWLAPPLFRCPGAPGDALLAQPVQGGFALFPQPPEMRSMELRPCDAPGEVDAV